MVLLRVEFTLLRTVASRTVRSYRTLSPLPDPIPKERPSAVCSLLHLSWACAPQALPGTLLYGARTFLPLISLPGDRPRDVNKAATTQSTPRRIVARSVSRVQKQSASTLNLGLTAYFAFNFESKAKKTAASSGFFNQTLFNQTSESEITFSFSLWRLAGQ